MIVTLAKGVRIMRAFVIVLIVLVAGFIGLGFYQNWFTLTVDKEKMKKDTNTAKDAVKDVFTGKEAKGKVKTVEDTENGFTLTPASGPEMKFWQTKENGKLAALKTGDEVTVKFREKDGKNEATSVIHVQK
jgi:Cu/Ag efflux protein CusF